MEHGWRGNWPAGYQDLHSTETQRFAREQASSLGFHRFLQWLASRDIAWRERQREIDAGQAMQAVEMRNADKRELWKALQQAGLAGAGAMPDSAPLEALLSFVAGTPAVMCHVALEDLAGEIEQVNLPGPPAADPLNSHPNWRRCLSSPVADLLHTGEAPALLQAIRQARMVTMWWIMVSLTRSGGRIRLAPPVCRGTQGGSAGALIRLLRRPWRACPTHQGLPARPCSDGWRLTIPWNLPGANVC